MFTLQYIIRLYLHLDPFRDISSSTCISICLSISVDARIYIYCTSVCICKYIYINDVCAPAISNLVVDLNIYIT